MRLGAPGWVQCSWPRSRRRRALADRRGGITSLCGEGEPTFAQIGDAERLTVADDDGVRVPDRRALRADSVSELFEREDQRLRRRVLRPRSAPRPGATRGASAARPRLDRAASRRRRGDGRAGRECSGWCHPRGYRAPRSGCLDRAARSGPSSSWCGGRGPAGCRPRRRTTRPRCSGRSHRRERTPSSRTRRRGSPCRRPRSRRGRPPRGASCSPTAPRRGVERMDLCRGGSVSFVHGPARRRVGSSQPVRRSARRLGVKLSGSTTEKRRTA